MVISTLNQNEYKVKIIVNHSLCLIHDTYAVSTNHHNIAISALTNNLFNPSKRVANTVLANIIDNPNQT